MMIIYLRIKQIFTKALVIGLLGFTTIATNGCNAIYWSEQENLLKVQSNGEFVVLLNNNTDNSQLNKSDILQFFKQIRSTLPTYKKTFIYAAEEQDLPWQLVASVAYQESHWKKNARSYTGVRGLMQLTEETAEHLGVTDRTDPEQSILGGARYIRKLLDNVPNHINHEDRLALALAAYNIGSGHLKDAQKLADKKGFNPYSWQHLRKIIPLLANPEYAADLQFGPARGHETVEFVERVKSFYSILLQSHIVG